MWGSLGKLRTPRTCGTCEQAEESWCDWETEGTRQPHCVRPHHSPPGTGRKLQDPWERTERCIKQVTKAVQLAFLGKGLERAKVYGGRLVRGLLRYTVPEGNDDDLDAEKGSGHRGQ